jgi:enterochelin esterase family protein
MNEYGMSAEYVAFFTEELSAWVDAHFRTVCDPSARFVVGDSYGGLISLTIGLRRPDIFGMAYSQSGYMSFNKDQLLKELAARDRVGGRFYLDCGTYERCVARGIVPDEEGDFLAANRRMARLMEHKHVDMVYREYPEGHTWGNWRGHLHDALEHFFGSKCERGT